MAEIPASRFASARLVVKDLQKQAEFYRAVFGFGEGLFIADQIKGRPIEEIIFMDPGGNAGIILLEFKDGGDPSPSGVMLVFFCKDIEAFEKLVIASGGSVFQEIGPIDLGDHTAQMGIFADPEGFLLEVIEGE